MAGLFDLPHLCPPCVYQEFSFHPTTKWGELNETSYTMHLAQIGADEHELPSSPNASCWQTTFNKKEAMFFFQTAGNPASQASPNNADLFLPQLMCI